LKISGFTFIRNATKYYYPIKQAIQSILPIVDEFVVAMGESDLDDFTEAEILSIGSDKIRIIHRKWDEDLFRDGHIFSHETNAALLECKGDWCFYIQADEVFHEDGLQIVKAACQNYLDDKRVEGFLFQYRHFWGDYHHVLDFHGWYNKEVRIIRNKIGLESFGDAQSFRKTTGEKPVVVELPVKMFHYGWVRPPELMRSTKKEKETQYIGREQALQRFETEPEIYSYGPLGRIPVFKGSHPAVMKDWMAKIHWKSNLDYSRTFYDPKRDLKKHERTRYRLLTRVEKMFFGGKRIFGYKSWELIG